MDKILITGGVGFIGGHLTERLLGDGHKVVCLDNFNNYYDPTIKRKRVKSFLLNDNFTLAEGDIRDNSLLAELFAASGFDYVVHLAGEGGVRKSLVNPSLYVDVNIGGTLNLLETVKEHPLKGFIFASSSSVYGNGEKIPFSEKDEVVPISPYGATKRMTEILCETYHHLYHIPITILRFFTVYGPRQRPEMAIHKFTRQIMAGEEVTLYDAMNTKRDYTYISDIIDGIMATIHRRSGFEVFNLGSSSSIHLWYLLTLLEHHIGKRAKANHLPANSCDAIITQANITKARDLLGYSPKVGIEEGIARFVEWYRNEN